MGVDFTDLLLCLLLCVGLLTAYIVAAPPGLVWGDGTELLYAMKHFQTVHPPGYPTFLMLGRTLLGLGSIPVLPGGHWLSGLYTCLGLIPLYFFLRRRALDRLSVLASLLCLSLSYPVWMISIRVEVYSLAFFFFSSSLLLWDLVKRSGEGHGWMALWVGLSLTHHPVGLLNVVLVLDTLRPLHKRVHWTHLVMFVAPVITYGLLLYPSAAFPFNWPQLGTLADLVNHMLGGSFRDFILRRGWLTPLYQLMPLIFSHLLVFPLVGVIIILFGLTKSRGREGFLLKLGLGFLGFMLLYDVPDLRDFLVPSYALSTVFLARGFQGLREQVGLGGWGVAATLSLLSLLILSQLAELDYRHSDGTTAGTWAGRVSQSIRSGVVLTDWGHYTPLRYYQLEGKGLKRVSLLSVSRFRKQWGAIARMHLRQGLRVYVTDTRWEVPEGIRLIDRGALFEVVAENDS